MCRSDTSPLNLDPLLLGELFSVTLAPPPLFPPSIASSCFDFSPVTVIHPPSVSQRRSRVTSSVACHILSGCPSFYKYLLSTYCVLDLLPSPGSIGGNLSNKVCL